MSQVSCLCQLEAVEIPCQSVALDEILNNPVGLFYSIVETVIYDRAVILRSKSKLIGCLPHPLLDYIWSIGGSAFQTTAQFINRRWHDIQCECSVTVDTLYIQGSFHIYIKHYI